MITLNEIPDDLRAPAGREWTPRRRLVRGTTYATIAGVILAIAVAFIKYSAPAMLHSFWVLRFAWGFLIAWILFTVMYRSAGMVSPICPAVVVVCACLVILAKHVALVASLAQQQAPGSAPWILFNVRDLLLINWPAGVGIFIATILCKDGEHTLIDLVDLAMSNVFTGRRG